jgi:hypothetical protein
MGVVHSEGVTSRLKFFRPQYGDDEVGEAGNGDETDDQVFHKGKGSRRRVEGVG